MRGLRAILFAALGFVDAFTAVAQEVGGGSPTYVNRVPTVACAASQWTRALAVSGGLPAWTCAQPQFSNLANTATQLFGVANTWTAAQTFSGGVNFPTSSYAQVVTTGAGAAVFSPVLDATAFGAVGDATINNNAALSAISAQASALHTVGYPGVEIRFPCGRFKATAQFSLSPTNGKNVTIKGGGNNCTELFFSGSNGIVVNLANQYASATVEDMGIVTDDTTGAYTGVRFSLPAGILNPFNATNAMNRVSLHGYDGYGTNTYWGVGFFQDKSSFVNLADFNYAGATGNKGIGIKLQGDAGNSHFNVVTNVTHSNFAFYDKAIWYGTYYQGLAVTTSNFTGGAYGIYVPAGAAMVDQLSVTNSQFGQNATADIYLGSKMTALILTGNLFIPRGAAISTAGLINSVIVGNSFQAYTNGVGTAMLIGSSADTSESVAISGNTILSLASGINIASGAVASISSNVIWNTTSPYSNSSSTAFQSGNIINGALLSGQYSSIYATGVVSAAVAHLTSPAAPAASSCGTGPSVDASSSANSGKFTIGSAATACTLTFAVAYPNYAWCSVTPMAAPATIANVPYISAQSKTAFTVSGGTASASYTYKCGGS